METIFYQNYKSPYGELVIGSYKDSLCLCDWKYRKARNLVDNRIKKHLNASFKESSSPVIKQTINQLEGYFEKSTESFCVKLKLCGTPFQNSVWNALMAIPYGETISYKELASKLGKPNSIRAVANANGANALAIVIPCHRVIGLNNQLVGYAGGLRAKQKLLSLEKMAM